MSKSNSELNWLAFRYVANELDPTETSDFESLMLTDQSAREAVAKMVGETVTFRSAFASDNVAAASLQRENWSRKTIRVTVVSVGSCLTLLLAMLLVRSTSSPIDRVAGDVIESESLASPAQLAYAWAESRRGLGELRQSTSVNASDPMDVVLNDTFVSDLDQPLVAPSWMLAALTKQATGINSELEVQE